MASTTSFRAYGDKQTADGLRYVAGRLLERVQQEMSWNKIPHLKRSFFIQPCAMSPLGAEVVISCCYGVNNIHVYVPFAVPAQIAPEPEILEKAYLHMKIYPDQETDRTGYSLVWDIENNRFPVDEFGISGIVATGELGQFLDRTQNDAKPLFEVEEDVLFNDLLQNREVKWDDREDYHYHVPALKDHSAPNEEIPDYALFLEESGGAIVDSNIWAEMTFTWDSECFNACDCKGDPLVLASCLKDLYWGDPIRETWESEFEAIGELELSEQLLTHLEYAGYTEAWDGMSNDKTRNSLAGTRIHDGTDAQVRVVSLAPSEMKKYVKMTSTASELYHETLEDRSSVSETHEEYTNTVIVDRCHYLTAYLLFQDYLFFAYNTKNPPLHDCIKAPILPSFTVETGGERPATEFNVKITYIADHDENHYRGGRSRDPYDNWDTEYGWFHYIGNPSSFPGNELDALYYQTFEFFTPLGSIGSIQCKHETYQNYTWCGDWRGKTQEYHGIDSIEEQAMNLRFFFGRPSYLGCAGKNGIAQVYAYDFNYHDVISFPAIDGLSMEYEGNIYKEPRDLYYPNHENKKREWHNGQCATVLEDMVKGQRQLIVGASASVNPGTPLQEMVRSPELEQAVKDLFDTYYAANGLPLTTVDEDYMVELEIVTLQKEM